MNRLTCALISTGALLAVAAPAFADDATTTTEAGASGDATVSTGGAGGTMDANGTATGAVTAVAGVSSKSILDRRLVLPKGKLGAYGNVYILKLTITDPMTMMSSTATAEGLQVGAGYGVTDKITAGANYAFSLHDFEIKGPLTLYGNMELVDDGKLSVGASASLLINLGDTTTEALQAGLGVRYKVAPKIAVFTGGGSFPGSTISFGDAYGPIAGSPLGGHLSIGFNGNQPIAFDIPVGVGLQATPELYVGVSTSLGRIAIKDAGDSAFFGADFIPVNVGALYNVNQNIDAGAFILLPDMKEIQFDLMFIGFGARYYN